MPDAEWWDVPEHVYHADKESISQSMLKTFMRSPPEYAARYVTRTLPPTPPSAAMQFGSLVHVLLLEPDRSGGDIVVMPEGLNLKRKADREIRDGLIDALKPGQLLVSPDDYARAKAAVASLRAHPVIASVLAEAEHIERSARWVDRATGLPLRCRFDAVTASGLCLDVKTTGGYLDAFHRSAAGFGYHVQAAFYRWGLAELGFDAPRFLLAAVRSEAPHDVLVFELTPDALGRGHSKIVAGLERLDQCIATGLWEHENANEVIPLELPPWA